MTSKKHETTPDTSKPEAEEETIPGTQSTARLSIWVAVTIIAIALVGYLTSRSSFKAEDVAQGITTLSEDVAGYLASSGYEGEFSYASLALEGSFFDRKAVIEQPEFVLRRTGSGEEMHVSTERAVIQPENARMNSFNLILDKPLVVSKGEAEYRFIQELPLTLSVHRVSDEDKKSLEYSSDYKEGMSFILQVADAAASMPDTSYQLRLGVGSAIHGVLDLKENSYYEESNLQDVSAEISQSIIKAETLKMVYEVAGHDNSHFRHYTVDGNGFTFVGSQQGLGKLDMAFEMEEETPLSPEAAERHVTLNNLAIKGEDFSISGDGQLDVHDGEMLPYGSLGTEITSMQNLVSRLGKANIIPEASAPLIANILERAATPTDKPETVKLQLQRSPGGAFTIGNSTFEELAVSLLGDMVRGQKPLPNAVPAPSEEPAPAPGEQAVPGEQEEDAAPVEQDEEPAPATETPEESTSPDTSDAAPVPEEKKKIRTPAEAMEKVQEMLEILKERKREKAAAEGEVVAPSQTDTVAPSKAPAEIIEPEAESKPATEGAASDTSTPAE